MGEVVGEYIRSDSRDTLFLSDVYGGILLGTHGILGDCLCVRCGLCCGHGAKILHWLCGQKRDHRHGEEADSKTVPEDLVCSGSIDSAPSGSADIRVLFNANVEAFDFAETEPLATVCQGHELLWYV